MNNFRDCIYRVESALIRRALREANGSVTAAARLLGFNHHYKLVNLINRHPEVEAERKMPRIRRKSIMPHPAQNRGEWDRPAL